LTEGEKLRVGALAEDFTLADSAGALRTLSSMLSDGPLLIISYRGYW
jgi:peroxiredoxin